MADAEEPEPVQEQAGIITQIRSKVGTIFFLAVSNYHRNDIMHEVVQILDGVIDHMRRMFGPPNPNGLNMVMESGDESASGDSADSDETIQPKAEEDTPDFPFEEVPER